tara:strand:+ start:530 stop:1711 length:1182 start_codon:yes stop_codon:yes gene_type:complete
MSSYLLNEFLFSIDEEYIQPHYLKETQSNFIVNNSLRYYLTEIKMEIDKYPEKWEQFKKITNKYEYINTSCVLEKHKLNTCVCSYKPISRSYFKMIEILHYFKFNFPSNMSSFHLAEGPGGFIEALQKFRNNKKDSYTGMTLIDDDKDVPKWNKIQNYIKQHPEIHLEYGPHRDGNLYYRHNLKYIFENHKNKYNFVTADGGFDYSVDFNKQEENSVNLIFCETLYALILQKEGGSFVLKVFDIFHKTTLEIIYLLCYFYNQVYVFKPHTSREANSERYIVCKDFRKKTNYENIIKQLMSGFYDLSKQKLSSIFNYDLNNFYLSKIQEINAIYGQQQVENILLTLNYIHDSYNNKDKIEKIKHNNVEKCIKWCKEHNQAVAIVLQDLNCCLHN